MIDFRKAGTQIYHDPWRDADRTCRFVGKCVLCGTRTYAFDDGDNDPRGILGDHTAATLVAEEYEMQGPDVPACFGCQNNSEALYNMAVHRAKSRWLEGKKSKS